MHVIFVEPGFPANQRRFPVALRRAGALVSAVGEAPWEALGDEVRSSLAVYEQVRSVCDEEAMLAAVRSIQRRGWVDRLESTVEAHTLPVARVRAACGIPGTTERTAFLCRDKPAMKDVLRAAGVPTARSLGTDALDEARRFAAEVGYPLIVKPRSAAGASGTYKVRDDAEFARALEESYVGRGGSVAVEEFIEGHEAFYDTISVGGRVVHEFVSHYYPGVLEAMRERWISPYIVTTNRIDAAGYGEVKEMGARVIEALGIGTSATHMEWFYGPKGLKFSEIGCRPPGVCMWDVYGAANEMDLYLEWAHAIVGNGPAARPSRRFAGGMINLRPDRDGRIAGYENREQVVERLGDCLIDAHFPPPGTPTQPVSAGYMANAWMRVRHPDYDELRSILDWVGRTLRVRAAPG